MPGRARHRRKMTIAWIKERFEKYSTEEITKINECEVVVTFYIEVDNVKSVWQEVTFTTNPTGSSWDDLVFGAKSVKIVSKLDVEYKKEIFILIDFSREENLQSRFVKALYHLNTFCEKKKETF